MRNLLKQAVCLLIVLCVTATLGLPARAGAPTMEATILFTHDLHSHLLPAAEDGGGEYGGYARLMTAIRNQQEQHPGAILVDGGDFSMGSLFQTAYPTSAIELRMMGAMGYDATTFGNHEFDYLPRGLASMLNAAVSSGDPLPAVVNANYWPDPEKEDAGLVREAMENYGVQEYMLLEREGIWYALIGLVGENSNACAPNSGMLYEDPFAAAQRTVDAAVAECWEANGVKPLVVALSHSGTSDGQGEDVELAANVSGIHLIVSGHTHTTLDQPIQVNDTWIVSAGEYGRNLGVVQMDYKPDGTAVLTDYELIPIDETVPEQPDIAALVEAYKTDVEENYLADYGLGFDEVLTRNPYVFEKKGALYDYAHESTLCNVFSDAYRRAASKALGFEVDVALTASGVVRESIPLGEVRTFDIFNAASLGVGTEGELVEVWVTGRDLKNVLEVDASVYPLMHSAQLFCSGVEYSFNTNRMIFNKVDYAMLRRDDGTLEEIQDDRLYCLAVGTFMAQMLGNVEKTSMGLLTIVPRDAQGVPMDQTRLTDYVIRDEKGVAVKEWFAIASWLKDMGGEMDARYAATDGRKVVYSSLNPVTLLRNANHFTWIALGVILVLVLLAVLLVRMIRRAIRKKRK